MAMDQLIIVNPCQVILGVKLSLTLVPKLIKIYSYASSYESPRERHSITFDLFSTKPPRGFILPEQEVYKGVNRGITLLNIIKGKYNHKITFIFKYFFLNLIIEPGPRFYISFLTGIIYKKFKL
jgi:hypothetical protein